MKNSFVIAVASGKGGTGKTTVSLNLAQCHDRRVVLLDCDVEQPNCHLFFDNELVHCREVTVTVPEIKPGECGSCGDCGKFCQFNAIVNIGTEPLLFSELCHSCGGCIKVCPLNALTENKKRIGVIERLIDDKVLLMAGRLDVGNAMAPPVIRAVKEQVEDSEAVVIIDAPPGTSCSAVEAVRGVDYTVLVTEATPFGLHDLKLSVAMLRELAIPFGVIINRADTSDDRVETYCQEESIDVLLQLPNDRRVAEAYSHGKTMVEAFPEYKEDFAKVWQQLENLNVEKQR